VWLFRGSPLGIWQRVRGRFSKQKDLFNLQIDPAYAIKASRTNPYFQALERAAREAGYLGIFIVDAGGCLRPGSHQGLTTRHAALTLDIYPNAAALEGRTVANYDTPGAPRRVPKATLALDDDSELLLWMEGGSTRVGGPGIEPTPRTK
jgi:hypothetical protein